MGVTNYLLNGMILQVSKQPGLFFHCSVEQWKKPWLVRLYRDYTTQLYRDYNEPLFSDPYKPTRIQWKVIFGFFSLLSWILCVCVPPLVLFLETHRGPVRKCAVSRLKSVTRTDLTPTKMTPETVGFLGKVPLETIFQKKCIIKKDNINNKTWPLDTPWKINMEPINHPFGKENDLPNLHDYVPC